MKHNRRILGFLLLIFIAALCACSAPCRHLWVTDPAVASTCTQGGLTEGKHCADCGEILVDQTYVAPLGHQYSDWYTSEHATTGQWIQTRYCLQCAESEYLYPETPVQVNKLGSAAELSGRTLLISIYANDASTRWDFSTDWDNETAWLMRTHMGLAADWLEQQCRSYGVSSEFIYEWETYSDLVYSWDFGQENLVRVDGGGYQTQKTFVDTYIPSEELKLKYNAENIIYVFHFNTNEYNTVNSWTLSDTSNCDTEIINVFVRDDYAGGFYYMSASCFAHEILHCFGAYDLYYASEAIPQSYVDYCMNTGSNDIMYTVGLDAEITQVLSPLDAYYVGLIDTCDLVALWGLAPSTHADQP